MNTLPLQSARGVTVVVRGGSPTPPPSPKAELSPTLPPRPKHPMTQAKRARRNFFKRLLAKCKRRSRAVPMTSPHGGWPSDRAKVEAVCDHYGVAAEMRARLLARIDAISAEIDLHFSEATAFLAKEHSEEDYRAWAIGYGAIPPAAPFLSKTALKKLFKTKVFVNIYDHMYLLKAGAFEPQMRMVSVGPAGGEGDDDAPTPAVPTPMLVHVPSAAAIRLLFPSFGELRDFSIAHDLLYPLKEAKSMETSKVFLKHIFGRRMRVKGQGEMVGGSDTE
jgi:hypothetical protein